MENQLAYLRELPTSYENLHESMVRSYHLLEYVKTMLKRGDSKETILEIIESVEDTRIIFTNIK